MIKRISSYKCLVPLALVVALSLALAAAPALGLSVGNAAMVRNVNPGGTYTHTMTVTIDSDDEATDVSVYVAGLQQSPDGGYQLLDASQDTSRYSARQFVTFDKAAFHLEPGGSEDVTATVTVPQDVGDGGRYAMIHIVTQPAATGGVGMAAAVDVPVYLTVNNSQLIHTGEITGVASGEITSGQPINIWTDFQSTGNHHFKVKGEVTVTNDRGQTLDIITTPVTSSSILPGMVRKLEASFIPSVVLAVGTYTVGSKVMLEDGTLLDQSSTTFEVTDPYTAPPGTLVISAVNASGITVSGATITWTTNEAATSQVEYGLTEEWGSSTTLETLVASHSVELTGLKADTTYHYRVISKDAANNEAVSLDQTFTTAGSSGGMPAWVWAIFVVMGMGVVGGACAAYFIGARMAKKK
jgi:hypothetical protein